MYILRVYVSKTLNIYEVMNNVINHHGNNYKLV